MTHEDYQLKPAHVRFLKVFGRLKSEPLSEAGQLEAYRQAAGRGVDDVALLGRIYAPYMEMVFALCYKYLKDEEASKDAVMQIFEKLIIELKTHEVTHFKSWLHTVCRNFCLMQLRAQKTFLVVNDGYSNDDHGAFLVDEPEAPIFEEGQFEALEVCMGTLSVEQRTAIRLFYQEEKCYREICEETGYDANKVKSHIQNGKRNLKICIEKNVRK